MIACAEWLGRDHTTCTRKPDGCACETMRDATDLIAAKAPLPKGAQMLKSDGRWERLTDNQLDSANRVPNHMSETEPFWLHGWTDLHHRIRHNAGDKPPQVGLD